MNSSTRSRARVTPLVSVLHGTLGPGCDGPQTVATAAYTFCLCMASEPQEHHRPSDDGRPEEAL